MMSRRAMAKRDEDREKRLAEALRENLRRRKAQARGEEPELRPGTGRGTAGEAGGGGGPDSSKPEAGPLRQPAAGPPPRSGEES